MYDQGVFTYGYPAEYDVSQVIYHGAANGFFWFSFFYTTIFLRGIQFCPRPFKGVYALRIIGAGEDTEQHICAAASAREVERDIDSFSPVLPRPGFFGHSVPIAQHQLCLLSEKCGIDAAHRRRG